MSINPVAQFAVIWKEEDGYYRVDLFTEPQPTPFEFGTAWDEADHDGPFATAEEALACNPIQKRS